MTQLRVKKERQSNIEALRLISMLMVLNLHSFWGNETGGGIFQALDYFRETTSICAVDCFVLISGYFGINWKFKSFFNLIFQIFFYSIGVYLVAVGIGAVEWNLKDFVVRFACLFASSWGFVVSYVMLYFSAPLLNSFSEFNSTRTLFIYILAIFFAINFISLPTSSFFTYAMIYLIGRFLRKSRIEDVEIPAGMAYWLITVLIFLLVYFLLYKTLKISDASTIQNLPIGIIGYAYSSPLVILQAIFLFLFFTKLSFNKRLGKIINWCAASSFAIFLIHMHPTIKEIGYYSYTKNLYSYAPLEHVLYLILFITVVFFFSIFVDKIRITFSNFCYSLIMSVHALVPTKFKRVETYLPLKIISVIK